MVNAHAGRIILALALLTTPAWARPQWLPISDDETVHLDYNSIRARGSIRSATVSIRDEDGTETMVLHIDCKGWRYAFTLQDYNGSRTFEWVYIGKDTTGEVAARTMCPSTNL